MQRLVKTIRDMAGAPQKLPAAAGVSHPQPSHPQCSHPQQQLPKEVAEQLATVEAPPTEPTILLKQLSVDQVCNLLHSLEMGNYAAGCREQKVSGRKLELMDNEDLAECGVGLKIDRKTLLSYVQEYVADGVPLSKIVRTPSFHENLPVNVGLVWNRARAQNSVL